MKYKAIDLFAGAGGLSEGVQQSGQFNILAHVEWDKNMVKVLRDRLQDKWGCTVQEAKERVIEFDIQKTKELLDGGVSSSENSELFNKKGLKGVIRNNKIDVVIGGPPCQAYSLAGRAQDKDSMKNDYRNYLFLSFAKVVQDLQPKCFVFENVPGILNAKPNGKLIIEEIYNEFLKIGYNILSPSELKSAVFDTSEYLVPQIRKRVVIFGVRSDVKANLKDFYDILRSFATNKVLTVKDALAKYPKIYPLEKPFKKGNRNYSHEIVESKYHNHVARYVNEKNLKIFKEWVDKKMNDWPIQDQLDYYFKMTGKKTNHFKYRSLEWNKPSPTVVAHLYKDGYMFIHPDAKQSRSITVREAAALMTFPDDFQFNIADTHAFKMIGNAVPVNFAKYIGKSVGIFLDNLKD